MFPHFHVHPPDVPSLSFPLSHIVQVSDTTIPLFDNSLSLSDFYVFYAYLLQTRGRRAGVCRYI